MANLLNQLQILKYSLKQYDSAENDLLRAISLVPENAVYHYNLALIYERVGRREDWEACIDRMMLLEGLGEKHLRHMMKAYREFGREEDARKVEVMLVRLAEVDPSAGGLE